MIIVPEERLRGCGVENNDDRTWLILGKWGPELEMEKCTRAPQQLRDL